MTMYLALINQPIDEFERNSWVLFHNDEDMKKYSQYCRSVKLITKIPEDRYFISFNPPEYGVVVPITMDRIDDIVEPDAFKKAIEESKKEVIPEPTPEPEPIPEPEPAPEPEPPVEEPIKEEKIEEEPKVEEEPIEVVDKDVIAPSSTTSVFEEEPKMENPDIRMDHTEPKKKLDRETE